MWSYSYALLASLGSLASPFFLNFMYIFNLYQWQNGNNNNNNNNKYNNMNMDI